MITLLFMKISFTTRDAKVILYYMLLLLLLLLFLATLTRATHYFIELLECHADKWIKVIKWTLHFETREASKISLSEQSLKLGEQSLEG